MKKPASAWKAGGPKAMATLVVGDAPRDSETPVARNFYLRMAALYIDRG
jgi:hypothetical protein